MRFTSFTVAVAAVATSTYAQSLSSGCTSTVTQLALGDLGQCLALSQILTLVSSSGSVVGPLNTYLTSLCSSSTPTCSSSTLVSANNSIASGCSSDISAGGSTATTIVGLETILKNYPQVYAAACSKNGTTSNFCLVDTLYAIQNSTGQTLTTSSVTSLLSGDTSSLSSLNTALGSGQLCTGCIGGFIYEAQQANSSVSSLPAIQSIKATCGSNFGSSLNGVTGPSSTSPSTSATSSAAASSSRAAGHLSSSIGASFPAIAAALTIVGGAIAGGIAIM